MNRVTRPAACIGAGAALAMPIAGRGFDLKAADARSLHHSFSARFAEPRVVKTGTQIVQERTLEAMERGGNAMGHHRDRAIARPAGSAAPDQGSREGD